jgi:major vault protein
MADSTTRYGAASTSLMDESNVLSNVAFAGDDVQRKTIYTPPRTITLDTKYDGAVNINIWPGYAVQVVSKNGKRRIVIGPESVILHYDETLEIMGLSTGKPKSDDSIYETVYLRVKNNRISDIVEADTKDMVHIQTRVNYRVNFEAKAEQWFSVENYVKFLTQNMRSIIRNEIQKHGIEDVAQNITSIIRDVILGAHTPEKDRTGRFFEENGMKVYDVEILTLIIGDEIIKQKLQNAQHQTVQLALEIAAKKQELTAVREKEDCTKQMDSIISATKIAKAALSEAEALKGRELAKANKDFEKVLEALMAEIEAIRLEVKTNKSNAENEIEKAQLEMRVAAFEKKFKAITPDLISALENSKNTELATVFAEHIPQAGGGIGMVLGHQIIENLLGLVKGTSFEKTLRTLTTDKDQD